MATVIVTMADLETAVPLDRALEAGGTAVTLVASADDIDVGMVEGAPSEYRLDLEMPLHGLWQLVLQVRRGDDLHEIRAETSVADARETN